VKHLVRDLDQLKREVLVMGNYVEESIDRAIEALLNRDQVLAERVMSGDDVLDEKEVAIEEACLKVLALHQPVAHDLRFIVAVMKVNNDLERMGDIAVNIAKRAACLAVEPPLGGPLDFAAMTEKVQTMVRGSLDALVNLDTQLARRVLIQDDDVDTMNRRMFRVLQDMMAGKPGTVERAVHTLSVSRHLERIADLATNIAEDVVFMVDGEIIRHRGEQINRGSDPAV
jgi:phosphate transport system protein